jgi:hypothetical protein
VANVPPQNEPPQNQPPKDWVYPLVLLIVFSVLGVIALVGVLWLIGSEKLQSDEAARNVITVVVTIGTLVIALLLVLAVTLQQDGKATERFEKGKEVLAILVGILGTIVGFYFGTKVEADKKSPQPPAATGKSEGGAPKDKGKSGTKAGEPTPTSMPVLKPTPEPSPTFEPPATEPTASP